MRILITGGAGFLGSHLADRLLAAGHEVVALDNLQTGARGNVSHLDAHPRFRFVRHDVIDPWPDVGPLDQIYNLACPASPPLYQKDPIHTLKTSVWGALHGLETARRLGARFFQASTSEVYGDPVEHPQRESYRGNVNPTGPRACYDEGKRAAETLCFDFHRVHGVAVRVVRIFNTYGPRMNEADGRVVSNFIVQALRGEDITIYGAGRQTRAFCYVDDLLGGFVRLMNHPDETGPVNLGNPGEFTIRELAEKVLAATGSASRLVYRDLPVDDPQQRRPDISLAQQRLGWSPAVPLDEGLGKTIAWFRARLGR
jgi:UDP-glucuronate decarboxylase